MKFNDLRSKDICGIRRQSFWLVFLTWCKCRFLTGIAWLHMFSVDDQVRQVTGTVKICELIVNRTRSLDSHLPMWQKYPSQLMQKLWIGSPHDAPDFLPLLPKDIDESINWHKHSFVVVNSSCFLFAQKPSGSVRLALYVLWLRDQVFEQFPGSTYYCFFLSR